MPFGTLEVGDKAIPSFEPPFSEGVQSFTNINIVQVRYRTTYESIRSLVPQGLELENEPVMIVSLVEYKEGTLGSYNEYVHQVEVKRNGVAYDYNIILVLDGEAAVMFGREKFGLPKLFGHITISRDPISGVISGEGIRGLDEPLVKISFDPGSAVSKPMPQTPDPNSKQNMSMRVIGSPILGAPPSLRELIPCTMSLAGGTIQFGEGSVSFPSESRFDPLYKAPILKYEGCVYLEGCAATIEPPTEIFPF